MQVDQLAGWAPIRFHWRQSSAFVDWCYVGKSRFTEPFFDQAIERCLNNPFNLLFRRQTPIEVLGQWHEAQPGLPPTGFIFHLSRCGSTLISQMLAALPQNVVISEAAPIDSVIRSRFYKADITDQQRSAWLQWMISALGQRWSGDEKYFFIKFDSWSALDLSIIRQSFPCVPWIFVYRNPVEIMVSQLKRRGAHMVPGLIESEWLGVDVSSIFQMQPAEFSARMLATVCDSALQQHNEGDSMFINYCQLPAVVWTSLLDFFRIEYTAADIDRMRHAAQYDAKNPLLHFEGDSASKHRDASTQVREMANKWVMPLYDRLEAKRLSL